MSRLFVAWLALSPTIIGTAQMIQFRSGQYTPYA